MFNVNIKNKKEKILNFLKKIIIKIIIILFLLLLFLKLYIKKTKYQKKNNKNVSVCICTLGKQENKYIREYINHYLKYGVDKIFLYDNNDINGERFEDVIKDYIDKKFVKIINWRGIKKGIHKIMNDCYNKNNKKYDWLIYYELDEFINLYNYTNIKNFLTEDKFKKCQIIYLNLVCHTDNNLLYYENKSLEKRFPEIVKPSKKGRPLEVKFIIKGNITNIGINHLHVGNKKLRNCNGFGHPNKIKNIFTTEPDYKYYYIDHYYTKSTEEFINKINRGDIFNNSTEYFLHKVHKYYLQSKFTKEKIEMIENRTGLNLSIYKKLLNIK